MRSVLYHDPRVFLKIVAGRQIAVETTRGIFFYETLCGVWTSVDLFISRPPALVPSLHSPDRDGPRLARARLPSIITILVHSRRTNLVLRADPNPGGRRRAHRQGAHYRPRKVHLHEGERGRLRHGRRLARRHGQDADHLAAGRHQGHPRSRRLHVLQGLRRPQRPLRRLVVPRWQAHQRRRLLQVWKRA